MLTAQLLVQSSVQSNTTVAQHYVIYKPTCPANYDYRMASTRLPELQTMSKHEAAQIAVHYDYQIP